MRTILDLQLEGVAGLLGGGARDGGISQSILEQLLMAGMRIAFIDNDPRGKLVERRLRDRGADVLFVEGDLRSFDHAEHFVRVAEREFGPASVIVNAVGGHPEGITPGTASEIRSEDVLAYTELNVNTHVNLFQAARPSLLEQEGDRSFVGISTINSKLPWLQESAYAPTKSAMENYLLSCAAIHAPDGIRFNVICPGSCPGHNSKTWPDRLKDPRVRKHLNRVIPLGRLGRPRDISIWALMFVSPLTCWTTGQVLCVDGGVVGAGGQAAPPDGRWWSPGTGDTDGGQQVDECETATAPILVGT